MTSATIKKITSSQFEEAINQGVCLIDFFAEWCGPCRMLVPVLEEVAERRKSELTVAKLDIDEAQEIASQYRVTSIPTMILFKNGQEIGRLIGLKDADALIEFIDEKNG